jgi:hypothetical protein
MLAKFCAKDAKNQQTAENLSRQRKLRFAQKVWLFIAGLCEIEDLCLLLNSGDKT